MMTAMAGVPGFEPGMAVPKTTALPLGYTPLTRIFCINEAPYSGSLSSTQYVARKLNRKNVVRQASYLWIPYALTNCRNGSALEIFAKAFDPSYFVKLKGLLGCSSGAELRDCVVKLEEPNSRPKYNLKVPVPLLALSNVEEIAKAN